MCAWGAEKERTCALGAGGEVVVLNKSKIRQNTTPVGWHRALAQ